MVTPWLLLIYTVPRIPSRKRAAVWRDLKKVGAVYLRDGVCVLPTRDDTTAAIERIAAKVRAFEGQATIIAAASLDPETIAVIVAEARAARMSEYAELSHEVGNFLAHVEREHEHRELTFAELEELEADLDKLRRWFEQVRARDYFGVEDAHTRIMALLNRGDEALAGFLDEVYLDQERPT